MHKKNLDGMSKEQHEAVFKKAKRLMLINPGDLLAKHQYLQEYDFHELGASTSGIQKQWVCSMEVAVKAAELVKSGKQH